MEGNRLVIQDRQGRPIPPTTPAKDVDSVSFMPFAEGGLFGRDKMRIERETRKLMSIYPGIARVGNSLICRFDLGREGRPRVIRLDVPLYYPNVEPKASVQPFADLAGDIHTTHVYGDGTLCLTNDWNPRKHSLAWALRQAQYIVWRAGRIRNRW